MRMFVISDNNDTRVGMRLAGIEGVVVHEYEEVAQELEKVMADESIGIVLMTKKLITLCRDLVYDIKLNRRRPLIVEIPDRHGTGRKPNFITSYVNEAIGLKL